MLFSLFSEMPIFSPAMDSVSMDKACVYCLGRNGSLWHNYFKFFL